MFDDEIDYYEPHTCPYKEDINGDFETLCTCSPEDTQTCAEDV